MARFSQNKSRPSRPTVSPWMTAFYICAILLAPMLFMGMIPSAHAQDTEPKDTGVSGPGKPQAMLARVYEKTVANRGLPQSSVSISEQPTLVWVS